MCRSSGDLSIADGHRCPCCPRAFSWSTCGPKNSGVERFVAATGVIEFGHPIGGLPGGRASLCGRRRARKWADQTKAGMTRSAQIPPFGPMDAAHRHPQRRGGRERPRSGATNVTGFTETDESGRSGSQRSTPAATGQSHARAPFGCRGERGRDQSAGPRHATGAPAGGCAQTRRGRPREPPRSASSMPPTATSRSAPEPAASRSGRSRGTRTTGRPTRHRPRRG